ncbi:MAG: hypothetical protein AB1Z98_35100 [Nannocystaceae bacterium]
MRRLFATTSLALTIAALPACDKGDDKKDAADKAAANKGADAKAEDGAADGGKDGGAAEATATDLVALVPEGAKIMATVDLAGLMGSALYKQQGAMLESSPFGQNIAAAKACNVGPDTWKQMVLGVDPDGDDAVMIGMSATGIGVKANIECLAAKYKEQDAKADWKIEEADGRTMVTIDGGDAIAYAVDDDTMVIAGKAWNDAVKERVGGGGKSAAAGSLEPAMGLAKSGQHIVFAGLATPEMATGPLTGAKHFGGSFDLTAGIAMEATVAFADAAGSKAASDEITKQFEGVKAMASGVGIPKGVVDSVKIESADANMTVAFKATPTELEEVGKAAMGMMMMGGGAAPPPAPPQ